MALTTHQKQQVAMAIEALIKGFTDHDISQDTPVQQAFLKKLEALCTTFVATHCQSNTKKRKRKADNDSSAFTQWNTAQHKLLKDFITQFHAEYVTAFGENLCLLSEKTRPKNLIFRGRIGPMLIDAWETRPFDQRKFSALWSYFLFDKNMKRATFSISVDILNQNFSAENLDAIFYSIQKRRALPRNLNTSRFVPGKARYIGRDGKTELEILLNFFSYLGVLDKKHIPAIEQFSNEISLELTKELRKRIAQGVRWGKDFSVCMQYLRELTQKRKINESPQFCVGPLLFAKILSDLPLSPEQRDIFLRLNTHFIDSDKWMLPLNELDGFTERANPFSAQYQGEHSGSAALFLLIEGMEEGYIRLRAPSQLSLKKPQLWEAIFQGMSTEEVFTYLVCLISGDAQEAWASLVIKNKIGMLHGLDPVQRNYVLQQKPLLQFLYECTQLTDSVACLQPYFHDPAHAPIDPATDSYAERIPLQKINKILSTHELNGDAFVRRAENLSETIACVSDKSYSLFQNKKIQSSMIDIIFSLKQLEIFDPSFLVLCERLYQDTLPENIYQYNATLEILLAQCHLLLETYTVAQTFDERYPDMQEAYSALFTIWAYKMFSDPAFRKRNASLIDFQEAFTKEHGGAQHQYPYRHVVNTETMLSRDRIVWGFFFMNAFGLISDAFAERMHRIPLDRFFVNRTQTWENLMSPGWGLFRKISTLLVHKKHTTSIQTLAIGIDRLLTDGARRLIHRHLTQGLEVLHPVQANRARRPQAGVTGFLQDEQSVHTASAHRSTSASIKKLMARAQSVKLSLIVGENLRLALQQSLTQIQDTSKRAVTLRAVKRLLLLNPQNNNTYERDAGSGVHITRLFILLFSATKNLHFLSGAELSHAMNEQERSAYLKQLSHDAESRLFNALYFIQRDRNQAPPEEELTDLPACHSGAFVTLINEMQGSLVDCEVKLVNSETCFTALKTRFFNHLKEALNLEIQSASTSTEQKTIETLLKQLGTTGFMVEKSNNESSFLPLYSSTSDRSALLRLKIEKEVFKKLQADWEEQFKPNFEPSKDADVFWNELVNNWLMPLEDGLKAQLLQAIDLPWQEEEASSRKRRKIEA